MATENWLSTHAIHKDLGDLDVSIAASREKASADGNASV